MTGALSRAKAGLRPRTRLRNAQSAFDLGFARAARPRRLGPAQTVEVLGIYRDPEPIGAAVRELRSSQHQVRVRLGALGPVAPELAAETVHENMTLGKFQNVNLLFDDDSMKADWILVIDDDITFPAHFLDTFLETCRRLDYSLAQPAQTRWSNANWPVTRRKLGSVARDSRFVEVGPCTAIRRDAAELICPFPADLRFGWGLDFHWAHVMAAAGLSMGIVDIAAVVHDSRKVASTYSWQAAQDEGREFMSKAGAASPEVGHRSVRTHRFTRAGAS